MDKEKFITGKNLQENIDKFIRRKRGLEEALKSCFTSVTVQYSAGAFGRKSEVPLYDKEGIKDLIKKELDDVIIAITDLEEEFKNL
jgi:hypothetical protein